MITSALKDLPLGTKIKILDAGHGAYGCNGAIGKITNAHSKNGLYDFERGVNVELEDGETWRISESAQVEIISDSLKKEGE